MPEPHIIIVSGLPRSGTSMMMRMLAAAGVPPLSDGTRAPDDDNPLGYFELEAVKSTRQNHAWLNNAPGKAVKVVHILLRDLPPSFPYKIIMMHRDLDEVLSSQRAMLQRRGQPGASLPATDLKRVFTQQLEAARQWALAQPNCTCLDVHYHEVIRDPSTQATRIAQFIGRPESASLMAGAVETSLYRNRSPAPTPNTLPPRPPPPLR